MYSGTSGQSDCAIVPSRSSRSCSTNRTLDWSAIAVVLAERTQAPTAVLDPEGRIRVFNRAMEQAVGFSRFEVEYQEFAEFCRSEGRFSPAQWLTEARRGVLREHSTVMITKSGESLELTLELSVVGGALLVVATRVAPLSREICIRDRDLEYQIVGTGTQFGQLHALHAGGERVPFVPGARCFKTIHGLDEACERCPVLGNPAAPWPRSEVRFRATPDNEAVRSFELVTADREDDLVLRVRVRVVEESVLNAMNAAKIESVSTRAGLTPREREVLHYVLLGRTMEDIGSILGIASRTVKHHQARILEKLGADSRADLLRVLF